MPIDAVVDLDDRDVAMVREAIDFFTRSAFTFNLSTGLTVEPTRGGSDPTFEPIPGGKPPKRRYHVKADGYYNSMGGWC
jgi:hypothetical protein